MQYNLDWEFIMRQEAEGEYPEVVLPFVLNTPYLQKDIQLGIRIWELDAQNLDFTKKVVDYILRCFDKLFETAWTTMYYDLCGNDNYPDMAEHTLEEFYTKQIDFEGWCGDCDILLELNCGLMKEGRARYSFAIPTNYRDWLISDDDLRIYMDGNRAVAANTNNDNMQMAEASLAEVWYQYPGIFAQARQEMEKVGFQYAESFA